MRIVAKSGDDRLASVYVLAMDSGRRVECVDSAPSPYDRREKWVLIISTLYGCPVQCRFCDAGLRYRCKLSMEDMLGQVRLMVQARGNGQTIASRKFKVQFSRVGDPAFNPAVLDVLQAFPDIYDAPGFIPSVSSIAPANCGDFFARLLEIKKKLYARSFQFQFSLHSTDPAVRDWLIPVKKWSLPDMADYGRRFFDAGGRKITLNFVLAKGLVIDRDTLLAHFSPDYFIIKVTPLNPTFQARKHGMQSLLPGKQGNETVQMLRDAGYEVIVSIGDIEENHIGSNCGQYLHACERHTRPLRGAYTYPPVSPGAIIR